MAPDEHTSVDLAHDSRIRLAAFKWLEEQTAVRGEVLPWLLLIQGLVVDGQKVPLVSMQGIFTPRVLRDLPLSIRTSSEGPYDDHFAADDTLVYRYRGVDPAHPDNVKLREAMRLAVPLVYLHAVVKARYLAVWPVYIVGDDPGIPAFRVAADERSLLRRWDLKPGGVSYSPDADLRRRYVTRDVRQRLHQSGFRERVLAAYRQQCALCRLRHPELLEAAHIIPDTEPGGEPVVPNGLSLCRLHHGAFDSMLIGVRPDYTVEVRSDVLDEDDGPMLRFGLQALHDRPIWVPLSRALRPDPGLLERRYQRFRRAV